MNIALYNADLTVFPNLALMKLSAWHKTQGDDVEIYIPIKASIYDKVYSSKVFTFSSFDEPFGNVERGGTGYNLFNKLPDEIEHICPDYKIFNSSKSMGFLTRGCCRKCPWCVVPKKEGAIRSHADIKEFLRHDKVILMDNNVLAHNHGIEQIEKLGKLGVKVDFNQGLDARLIDDDIAKRLAKIKWLRPVRLACDTKEQMIHIQKAVMLLRWHNVRPTRYFVYVLVIDINEAMERIKFLKGLYCEPFAQPYRSLDGNTKPTQEQRHFARWVNHTAIFNSISWDKYKHKRELNENELSIEQQTHTRDLF